MNFIKHVNKAKQKKLLNMNKKQSITNYIYSKLQEAKKTSTEGKPAKPPKAKKPAKKPPTDPKPAAPNPRDSPERVAERQARRLERARQAQRDLRDHLKGLPPEEQEKQKAEIEKKIADLYDYVKTDEQQQYIADFVKNLLTEQSAKEQEEKQPVVHTNAAGRQFKQRHIDRAVGHHEVWDEGEAGSLEHIFDARYDHSTGRVTNKHTGKELPDHISQLWDERQERGRQRGSRRRAHDEDNFPEPNWKDDEED